MALVTTAALAIGSSILVFRTHEDTTPSAVVGSTIPAPRPADRDASTPPATKKQAGGETRTTSDLEGAPPTERFAWAPVPNASAYHVELFAVPNRVFAAETTKAQLDLPRRWRYKAKLRRLTPGEYRWFGGADHELRGLLITAYGETFAREFPERYTVKYHTTASRNLTTDWIGPRMYQPSLKEVLRGALAPAAPNVHYITGFRYPMQGGFVEYLREWATSAPARA